MQVGMKRGRENNGQLPNDRPNKYVRTGADASSSATLSTDSGSVMSVDDIDNLLRDTGSNDASLASLYRSGNYALRSALEEKAFYLCEQAINADRLQDLPWHTKILGILVAHDRQHPGRREQIENSLGGITPAQLKESLDAYKNGQLYLLPPELIDKIAMHFGSKNAVVRSLNKYGQAYLYPLSVNKLSGDFNVSDLPALLAKYPNVRHVDFSSAEGLDERLAAHALECIPPEAKPKIKGLNLQELSIDGVDLREFTGLTELDLSLAQDVSAQSLAAFLSSLPNGVKAQMSTLILCGLPFLEVDLSPFENLTTLDLSYADDITEQELASFLNSIPDAIKAKITTLNLSGLPLVSVNLAGFINLTDLDLSDANEMDLDSVRNVLNSIPDEAKAKITRLNLSKLCFAYMQNAVLEGADLGRFTSLTTLDLSSAQDIDAVAIANFLNAIPDRIKAQITSLNLSGLPLALASLAGFTHLADLDLSGATEMNDQSEANLLNSIPVRSQAALKVVGVDGRLVQAPALNRIQSS